MNSLKLKGVTTTLLIIIFITVSLTGIMLIGKTDTHKHPLKEIHTITGIIMIIIAIIHFMLNRKIYSSEIKQLTKKTTD